MAADDTFDFDDRSGHPLEDSGDAALIAGRYRLGEVLGRGGGGVVWEATDGLTGQPVAVKEVVVASAAGAVRLTRELTALRRLCLPGVVRILDDLSWRGRHFIIMEKVVGRPFPGEPRMGWDVLCGPSRRLLSVLGQVHRAGLVHRDLKPANVLVRPDGQPVLLDFGLARGALLPSTVTAQGAVVGTPGWLAPEQLSHGPIGPWTDLYAFGVMLYHALSGRIPHAGGSLDELLAQRRLLPAPRLDGPALGVPPAIVALVEALLARDPEDRPASAEEALVRMGGQARPALAGLPLLGRVELLDEAMHALEDGVPVRILGEPGSGRSRLVAALGDAARARGIDLGQPPPAERPFASLLALFEEEGAPSADPATALLERLASRLGPRSWLLVDDPALLDRWSRALLEQAPGPVLLAGAGAVARPDARCIGLSPLAEEELKPLFAGPDRVLHRRQDGAALLFAQSGGWPVRVAEQVEAWLGAGLARWSEGQLVLDAAAARGAHHLGAPSTLLPAGGEAPAEEELDALIAWVELMGPHATAPRLCTVTGRPPWQVALELDVLVELGCMQRVGDAGLLPHRASRRLAAWPRSRRRAAHAAIASVLDPAQQGRLAHLLAAGDAAGATEEAALLSRAAIAEGRQAEALELLIEVLAALRGLGWLESGGPLAGLLVRAAVGCWTRPALERACWELERVLGPSDDRVALLRAAVLARSGQATEGRLALDVLGPLADAELERCRQGARVAAATREGLPTLEAVVKGLQAAGPMAVGDGAMAADIEGWMGLLAYRQQRFDAAAQHHRRAFSLAQTVGEGLSARLNAASALLEAARLDEAEAEARAASERAAAVRHPVMEARAEWIRRSVRARLGAPGALDHELVEIAASMGNSDLLALICLTECAIALRTERWPEARLLGHRAGDAFAAGGNHPGETLARSWACGASPAGGDPVLELAEALLRLPPVLALDGLGVLARTGRLSAEQVNQGLALVERVPLEQRAILRGGMSPCEAALALSSAATQEQA